MVMVLVVNTGAISGRFESIRMYSWVGVEIKRLLFLSANNGAVCYRVDMQQG